MDRRAVGITVLAVAIVAALIVPTVGGRRVAGAAERTPTPDPPQVGDCLGDAATQPSPMNLDMPVFAAQTGPCGAGNFGEVVAVVPKVRFSPPTLDNGTSVAQAVDCNPFVRDYLGWAGPATDGAGGGGGSSPSPEWRPADTIAEGLLGPNLVQYFAGQRWVACVVDPEYVPFPGSIRGSVHYGTGADAFGSCRSTLDVAAAQAVRCFEPHLLEIFGWVGVTDRNQNLDESCVALVRDITGMTDPTAGGTLTVAAVIGQDVERDDSSSPSPKTPTNDQAVCTSSAAGSRLLTGTLIGLGERSVPWQ